MRNWKISIALGSLLMLSNTVLASLPPPVQVSEPSTLALLAAGAVAAIIGRRFYRNK